MEILNFLGVLCFMWATIEFQSTLGWSQSFRLMPDILGWAFLAAYLVVFVNAFFAAANAIEEYRLLANSRTFGLEQDGRFKPVTVANWLNDRVLFRDRQLFEHFMCKPLGANALGSEANPNYTISVPRGPPPSPTSPIQTGQFA